METSILFENYQVEAKLLCDAMAYAREKVELHRGASKMTERWLITEVALRKFLPNSRPESRGSERPGRSGKGRSCSV
ncbi:MAG: hypothetical protein AAF206_16155 [Bacteroidota bacterium]